MKKHVAELNGILGAENVTADPADLALYSYDAARLERLPDCVAFPATDAEVSSVLKYAHEEGVPIVPRGAGSGMAGGAVPEAGGIVLVFTRMNRILEIAAEDLYCRVEAGAVTGRIAAAVAARGLYYPPDPSSVNFSTIGGNIAHNSGGLHAVKYGVTKNWVIGLKAVLPGGEIIRTGVRTMKGVVGYDLTKLICGSEGTLAVVTEATLRLMPQPASRAVLVAAFPDPMSAGVAVSALFDERIIPAMCELLDGNSLRCVEEHVKAGFPRDAGGLLLVELDGRPESVKAELEAASAIMERHGAFSLRKAAEPAECEKLWEARRAVAPSLGKLSPRRISEDITVPRSKIPEALGKVREIGKRRGFDVAVFGHAGDGNLHVSLLVDQSDPALAASIEKAVEEVLAAALSLGGTISGEHGIGMAKRRFIGMEIGPEGLAVLRRIKQAFDPKNILNPHKVLPGDGRENSEKGG